MAYVEDGVEIYAYDFDIASVDNVLAVLLAGYFHSLGGWHFVAGSE